MWTKGACDVNARECFLPVFFLLFSLLPRSVLSAHNNWIMSKCFLCIQRHCAFAKRRKQNEPLYRITLALWEELLPRHSSRYRPENPRRRYMENSNRNSQEYVSLYRLGIRAAERMCEREKCIRMI